MTYRRIVTLLSFTALLILATPAAFAGCGQLCGFMDCGPGEPHEGCIERSFGCLDMLCYSATPAACEVEAAQVEERIDQALEGVDLNDRAAVAEALGKLDIPLRYVVEGEVIYESPNFELLKERNQQIRRGEVTQVAETEAAPAS